MNERIRELAEQSHLMDYVVQLYTVNAPDGYRQPLDVRMEAMSKFAELIVQECMSINRQRLFPDYEGDSHQVAHNNALICANSDLQRHFGVDQ